MTRSYATGRKYRKIELESTTGITIVITDFWINIIILYHRHKIYYNGLNPKIGMSGCHAALINLGGMIYEQMG